MKTIEEKAKAYDEIIERANTMLFASEVMYGKENNASQLITDIIPDLKESEDERIRKKLIGIFTNQSLCDVYNLKSEDVLAYLEKQKERPKEELVYRLNGLMQDYIKEGKDDEEKEHRFKCYHLFWDALEDTNFFEQKEQKPTPDWMPKFLDELRSMKNYFDWDEHRDIEGQILAIINWIAPNYFKEKEQKPHRFCDDTLKAIDKAREFDEQEQKPENKETGFPSVTKFVYNKSDEEFIRDCANILKANDFGTSAERLLSMLEQKPVEWSEEDWKLLDEVREHIIDVTGDKPDLTPNKIYEGFLDLIDRLKFAKPQPKKEWSEEDEENIESICSRLDSLLYTEDVVEKTNIVGEIAWLKSLRPHWKPSEEQIYTLERISSNLHLRASDDAPKLDEIIELLKQK